MRRIFVFYKSRKRKDLSRSLVEGEDYYLNAQGLLVFTAAYHLKRGYCCQNGCKHCPYGFRKKASAPGQDKE